MWALYFNVASVPSILVFTQAMELQVQRERERQEEEENNQRDILSHLQGELLSENPPPSARGRREYYKGLTPEQIREFTDCLQQQTEEKRVNSTHIHPSTFFHSQIIH